MCSVLFFGEADIRIRVKVRVRDLSHTITAHPKQTCQFRLGYNGELGFFVFEGLLSTTGVAWDAEVTLSDYLSLTLMSWGYNWFFVSHVHETATASFTFQEAAHRPNRSYTILSIFITMTLS